MTFVKCVFCEKLHDIAHIEPTLLRPDAILAIPKNERAVLTSEGKDFCVLRTSRPSFTDIFRRSNKRYFLRVTMPFSVVDRSQPCSWGIWVEVSREHYKRTNVLWDSPDQSREPPFPAVLANDIREYPPTCGLSGRVKLQSPSAIPVFTLDPADHPLSLQQQRGVSEDIVMGWLQPILH